MNVSAVIPTRGNVDLSEILDSLPRDWQKVVWDNSQRENLGVYGRYAALDECEHDTIWTQDDDCIVTPGAIEDICAVWQRVGGTAVCNMPDRFRANAFYKDHALVGFGAMFHRDLAASAFDRFMLYEAEHSKRTPVRETNGFGGVNPYHQWEFYRTCDIVFTGLTPLTLVDVPYRDLPWASDPDRMWRQPDHVGERTRMLELVRQVRDA